MTVTIMRNWLRFGSVRSGVTHWHQVVTADCKSEQFSLLIKRHSEKTGKFSHNRISRLGRVSENSSRRNGHAKALKRPQVRDFFAAPSPLNIEIYLTTRQICRSLVPASRLQSRLLRAPATWVIATTLPAEER